MPTHQDYQCLKHPKYQACFAPRTGCLTCWAVYWNRHPAVPVEGPQLAKCLLDFVAHHLPDAERKNEK